MKQTYQSPDFEEILLTSRDVIFTSGENVPGDIDGDGRPDEWTDDY